MLIQQLIKLAAEEQIEQSSVTQITEAVDSITPKLFKIAVKNLDVSTFTPVGRDSKDFVEVSVKAIGASLREAYDEGFKDGAKNGKSLKEAKEYDSSIDFEDDVSKVEQHFKAIEKIMKSAEWKDWMQATDTNYPGADAVSRTRDILKAVADTRKKFDEFYNKIIDVAE